MQTFDDIFQRIKAKNSCGLSLHDAQQLCLWLFCVLEVRPPEYRDIPLGREELVCIFSGLAREGYIKYTDAISKEEALKNDYWNKLIDDLIFKRIALEDDFRSKAAVYL
jgi:hypothetical protein